MKTSSSLLLVTFFNTLLLLNALPVPRIDSPFELNPYGYIESAPDSRMNQSRLYLDKIFSGFNLSFTYSINNSTDKISVSKILDLDKNLNPLPKDFVQAKPFISTDNSQDSYVVLYNQSLLILKISEDGSSEISNKAFTDVSCNDFIQPDPYRIILNCWNSETNQLAIGYYNISTTDMIFNAFDPYLPIPFSETGLHKIPKDDLPNFWRYYKGQNWIIEEWRIDEVTNQPIMDRRFNSTQLDPKLGMTHLVDLHMLDRNLTILSNASSVIALVNWAKNPPEIISYFAFSSNYTITGGKMFFSSESNVLFVEFDSVYLKALRMKAYDFEDMSYMFSPALAEKIYNYYLIDTHVLAIQSVNQTSGKYYLSIATLFPSTNGDVIYKELPSVPVSSFVLNSKFSSKDVLKFYAFMDDSLQRFFYNKPVINVVASMLSDVSNVIKINITSTTWSANMTMMMNYPIYYYNDTYFQVDTSQSISSDKFISGVYPSPRTITLKDLGVQAPLPKILEIELIGADVNDHEFMKDFPLIQTSDGVVALDPHGIYWAFQMNYQVSVYRCARGLDYCEPKGTVHWPLYQKRIEIFTEAYPFIILSYPSYERIDYSTFSIARIYDESLGNLIEEKYIGWSGSQLQTNCQALKVKKVKGSKYLLCLDSDIYGGNTTLTIFYLDELLPVKVQEQVKAIKNISLILDGFPPMDPDEYVGLSMALHEDLLFVMMDINFTMYCYNLSSMNYQNLTSNKSIPLVEEHQALNLLNGGRETYLYVNERDGILIIACPELGMIEEWLVLPSNSKGSVLQFYGQTLTYGESFDRGSVMEYKVSSPVSYSASSNTLYMMTSSNSNNNNLYVYQMDYRGGDYPYRPRFARGNFPCTEMKTPLVGVTALYKDSESDFLILWSSKNTLFQHYKELQLIIDTTSYNKSDISEIYELDVGLKVASSFTVTTPVKVRFNFSLYYMEDVILAVNSSGSYANKITLEDMSIIWALKPEDYFFGDVIELAIKTSDPSDLQKKYVNLLKRTEDDDSCKITNNLGYVWVLGTDMHRDNFTYVLTNTSLMKISTTKIYLDPDTQATIFSLPTPLTEEVSNFFLSPQGRWMHFYHRTNETIAILDLKKTQQGHLSQGILQSYSFTKYYQARFFNESLLTLTFECDNATVCANETFISIWDVNSNQSTVLLTYSDLSREINLNITDQTQIITKLDSLKDPDHMLLLATITDTPRDIYFFVVCSLQISADNLHCTISDLKDVIADYNISRYGVEWNSIDIISDNSNLSCLTWEVLLGNQVYNSYVLSVIMPRNGSPISLIVLYGLDNYLPNTQNTKISWSKRYIAVERGGKQVDNNFTNSNTHVMYYDRFNTDRFDVGQSYQLIKATGVSRLFQDNETAMLDPIRDGVLIFPLRVVEGYLIKIREFYVSFKIEFNDVTMIKSTELELCAQNVGSYNSVKIELIKFSPPSKKSYLPVIIAFGLLILGLVVGGLYYLYQKRAKALRKRHKTNDSHEVEGINPSGTREDLGDSLIHKVHGLKNSSIREL